jgi:hypothetical protein
MSREYYKIKAVDQYNDIEDFDFLNEKFNNRSENNEIQDYSEAYKNFYEQKKELNDCNYKSISLIKIIVTTDEYTLNFENLER